MTRMLCDVRALMDKDEQYARGWVRLYETKHNTARCAQVAQYAIDLMRLKNQHAETCETCKENK